MDSNIQRALNDKLYDKRKVGALEYVVPTSEQTSLVFEHPCMAHLRAAKQGACELDYKPLPLSRLLCMLIYADLSCLSVA